LEVRLITGPDEPYKWSYLPEKAHLFQKHLSKQTMGAYLELFDEVGKTFEAIAVSVNKVTEAAGHLGELNASFTTKIERLEQRCADLEEDRLRLVEEGERFHLQATENCLLKTSAEDELMTTKADLESAQAVIQQLRQQLETSSSMAKESEKLRAISVQDIDEVFRVLKSVRSGLCP
jgi:chromosome segregation ATPase